jgi:hypothetical protein
MECVMRTKFYSAMLTLGLLAAAAARSNHAADSAPTSSRTELVIDTSLTPTELHFSPPLQPAFVWLLTDTTVLDRDDFTELDLALSSPGLLFGLSRDFLAPSLAFRLRDYHRSGFARSLLNKPPSAP